MLTMKDFFENYPHRRLNPLTGEWVLVSPHRLQRPWQGKREALQQDRRSVYDSTCYLCPRNRRANGETNPDYQQTFVFTNDFAALLPETSQAVDGSHPLLRSEGVKGTCRVICFSPRHDLSLPEMAIEDIQEVIDTWAAQVAELSRSYRWVQIFENKGEIMGCSNPHPHGQVWASTALPNEPFKEDRQQRSYFEQHGSTMLIDYLNLEIEKKERIVAENEHWLIVVPFWAIWPFELLLLPQRHILHLPDLNEVEQTSLALILKFVLTKYDNLFNTSFPYSMGWHGAPTDEEDYSHWQLHAHFYPPLLCSRRIKKFIVGFEMLAEAQRDFTPERAAERLRSLSEIHYKKS